MILSNLFANDSIKIILDQPGASASHAGRKLEEARPKVLTRKKWDLT